MNNIELGLKLMAFGLAGVFTVLVLFFIMTRILMIVFQGKGSDN